MRVDPVGEFCADLRRLWKASGRDLPSVAREVRISRAQLYAILGGEIRRPPDFGALVRPLVLACGATDAELADWRRRHDVLVGVHEGLRHRPEPRTAGPNQLPARTGEFAGRTAALAKLDAATAPVVVVAGPPGVGKTALAVHWAHREAASFPDGQLYVDLRGYARDVVDPADAVRSLLDALGVPPHEVPVDRDARFARFRSLATGRRMLVVLDNARDADQVRPLLAGSSAVRTLVTSRNPLTALVAAAGATPVALDLPGEAEAAELLRARLGDREASAVDDAVKACGRLPLALALVAARVRQTGFPLAVAAAELRQPGSGAFAELRAVFAWSYQGLSPAAARLFRLLGLTAGPDIAVDAVAALAGTHDARAILGELVDAGLLVEHRPGRYLMHDLLRDHAGELAREGDDAKERRAALTRLLDFYTSTAHEADRVLNPSRAPIPLPVAAGNGDLPYEKALAWLDAERSVLLSALRQARDDGLDRHAWQLGWALDTYLFERRRFDDEGAAWFVALRAATALVDRAAAAHAHRFLGAVAGRLERFAEAYGHMRESMELCRAAGDRAGEAETEFVLSYVCWLQADQGRALEHIERSLLLWSDLNEPSWEGRAAMAVGWYRAQLGDHLAAVTFYERAIAVQRAAGDRANEAITRQGLGHSRLALGAHAAAAEQFELGRALARELGDPVLEAQYANHLGDVHRALGDADAARECWEYARERLARVGHPQTADVARKLG
ncbi:NB-ARC domain-containing protein [Asanoa ishikariensis]|uniref:NB-ARC domain-containing protein n=1 Tax=Asanoa ishikariensis TaxID=137265 RepID=A0A1H3TT48_9ACTN|nr:NB-ARC domain-containing protein [Asanoa ishikariensis]